MALERRNPLPVGRYAVSIQKRFVPEFTRFLGIVGRGIYLRQESYSVDPFTKQATINYLFDVLNPLIPWDSTKYGYPTIATGITELSQIDNVPGYSLMNELPEGTTDWFKPLLVLAALYLLG